MGASAPVSRSAAHFLAASSAFTGFSPDGYSTAAHDDRYDITTRSGGLRRRRITEKVFAGLAVGSAVVAVGILALVLGTVIHRGITELSLDFFTKPRPLFGQAGGIADALVGSALIVGMAMVMAIPCSILVAIFMGASSRTCTRSTRRSGSRPPRPRSS